MPVFAKKVACLGKLSYIGRELTLKNFSLDERNVNEVQSYPASLSKQAEHNPQTKQKQLCGDVLQKDSKGNIYPGVSACNLIKKRLQQRCFPVNFAKYLSILIL